MRSSNRSQRLKEAVVAAFRESAPSIEARFGEFSEGDWLRAMYWLDVSGLALYILDRLTLLGLEDCLPKPILDRLRHNMNDNRKRTVALFEEAAALGLELRRNNITFALLKGITLWPESVPDVALRSQMDIDILVRESDAAEARQCLENLGYVLGVVSGTTWEFRAGLGTAQFKDLYRVRAQRSVELHLFPSSVESSVSVRHDLLGRSQLQSFHGMLLPALSPPDLFVQQALHLFKHICSEYTRASWVLEFWRHVSARRSDAPFWREVRAIASSTPGAEVAIGVAIQITTLMFGQFAPADLSRWSMDQLPLSICLWVQLYGCRGLLADFPGSKLYLLLQSQLVPDAQTHQAALRRHLFPIHLPSNITHAVPGETLIARMLRYQIQSRYLLFRMRIHGIEGLRYLAESLRWQRRLEKLNGNRTGMMAISGGSLEH